MSIPLIIGAMKRERKWLTIKEAAELSGRDTSVLARSCRVETLKADKAAGGIWLIHIDDLNHYLKNVKRGGQPKNQEPPSES